MAYQGNSKEDYDVMELLGKGGFASVYRAVHKSSGHEVAIKMIERKTLISSGLIERVRQEVSIHIRLKHPYILDLLGVFEDANYVYLVLELCHGGEFQNVLRKRGGRLSEREAARFFHQVVEGLLYLHTHNILHRDLTLSNLLLTESGDIKIADFGLATQLKRPDERHMTLCGTPNFISPEVASRKSHGKEADVWSLGCMLYATIVGKAPFEKDGVRDTLNNVCVGQFQIPAFVSDAARDLIGKMLVKNPRQRIPLENILSHPFFTQVSDVRSLDSGMITMSVNGGSTRNPNYHPIHEEDENVLAGLPCCGHSSRSCHCRGRAFDDAPEYIRSATSFPVQHYSLQANISREFPAMGYSGPLKAVKGNWRPFIDESPERFEPLATSPSAPVLPLRGRSSSADHSNTPHRRYHLQTQSIDVPSQDRDIEYDRAKAPRRPASVGRMPIDRETVSVERERESKPFPQLNTRRLRPTRHKASKEIVTILDGGEVCVEILNTSRSSGEEKVTQVLRVSKDGSRVTVYRPNRGKGCAPRKNEPIPPSRRDEQTVTYSYDSLPKKLWPKYQIANRFVSFTKAITPKVTLYSDQARVFIMENGPDPDYEATFYSGGQVVRKKGRGITVTDHLGSKWSIGNEQEDSLFTGEAEEMWTHTQKCVRHCSAIIEKHEELESSPEISMECFPIIIGRRPQSNPISANPTVAMAQQRVSDPAEVSSDRRKGRSKDPLTSGNVSSSSQNLPLLPGKFFQGSIGVGSENEAHASSHSMSSKSGKRRSFVPPAGFVEVESVGWASEATNGQLSVIFLDGSELKMWTDADACVEARAADGAWEKYSKPDIPRRIKDKLGKVPRVVEALKKKKSALVSPSSAPVGIRT